MLQKALQRKWKTIHRNGENIWNYIYNMEHVSKIYKELLQIKKDNPIFLIGKGSQ